ncbi:MAG: hypothetical protein ACYSU4_01600, partial [Planctomycetota bacterium]
MSKLYDKKQSGLLSTRIPLLLLVLCSYFLIAELQSSVCHAKQSKSQMSGKSTKMTGPKVYMPELLKPGVADKLITLDFDQVDIK